MINFINFLPLFGPDNEINLSVNSNTAESYPSLTSTFPISPMCLSSSAGPPIYIKIFIKGDIC